MKRKITTELIKWKTSTRRKPLILEGARQVGKTYILAEFGQQEYAKLAYINFEVNPRLATIYNADLSPKRIIEELQAYVGFAITPNDTLIVLDEIQTCPKALTSLKYFHEQANQYHIAAAGSLLGVHLAPNEQQGFPVGQVNLLNLYPLSFFEFLQALHKEELLTFLQNKHDYEPLSSLMHQELLQLLKRYYIVGGMPEAVATYCQNSALNEVREVHKEILNTYLKDFAKHVPPNLIMRLNAIWDSLPAQLARENKKFIYSIVARTARAREYEAGIEWLTLAGLVLKAQQISVPKVPLSTYAEHQIFKLYALDVGLLSTKSGLPIDALINGHKLFTEFNGALTENYVAQQLRTIGQDLYYWTSGNQAEVDFILSKDATLIPLEVKAGENTKSKSLSVYADQYKPEITVKASLKNLNQRNKTIELPLYLLEILISNLL